MNNVAGGIRVARTRPRERACVRAPTRAHTMADRGTRGIEGYVFSSRARERAICSSLTCVHAVSRTCFHVRVDVPHYASVKQKGLNYSER